jgi:predicted nucleic acid-binding protein
MKKNKAHRAANYAFQKGEQILVDANIWLYLLPPPAQPTPRFASAYTGAFANLLTANAEPVIESLVLSEYLNRYLRLEYNAVWKGTYPIFKDFRNSGDFAPLARAAVTEAREILKLASPKDTLLSQGDIVGIMAETEAGTLDFNDGVLVETCRSAGWKLLTNDSDMTLGGIEVLTNHPGLLAACAT